MKPYAWSPTSLDTFVNCGRQYQAKYVTKEVAQEPQTAEQAYGETVHKHFENRQAHRMPLPDELSVHELKMVALEALPGHFFTEQKIALTKPPELRPVAWTWRRDEIWFRGVIDYIKIDRAVRHAHVIDYKTGKPHQKFRQLVIYAIYVFIAFRSIDSITVEFYWTKDPSIITKKTWQRSELDMLWGEIIGDLKQYRDAFKMDIWQERPSGLCRGHCPVKTCKHWQPKRKF